MHVELAHLVDAHEGALGAGLPLHAGGLAGVDATLQVLQGDRDLGRIEIGLAELPVEEVLHVRRVVEREQDFLGADGRRQELREVDRADPQRPLLLRDRCVDRRIRGGVFRHPLAALGVGQRVAVRADVMVAPGLRVHPDALGEVVVERLLAAAGRALGMETGLAAALVPVMNIRIRPVRGRAHQGEADVRGG
ncbi:hypothetical protein D3C76_1167510 [compost metagenome]